MQLRVENSEKVYIKLIVTLNFTSFHDNVQLDHIFPFVSIIDIKLYYHVVKCCKKD